MTWGGGREHAVGDRGQRYEVTYMDVSDAQTKRFGWSDTIEGAERMCRSIDLHPSMDAPSIRDRHSNTIVKRP